VAAPGQAIFRLRLTLDDVAPTVWRRLLVPGNIRLGKLHDVFQVAMGWTDSHLHRFSIADQIYGQQFDEYPEGEIDENEISVAQAIGEHRQFSYEYDFGDSWNHEIVIEDKVRLPRGLKHTVCLEGQNACPPEDCGGPGGYAELLVALGDPDHEEHDELLKWLGAPFDSTEFDLVAVNVALQRPG
jgi:hypothetical protein